MRGTTGLILAVALCATLSAAQSSAHIVLPSSGGGNTILFVQPIGQSFTADRTSYPRLGLWFEDVNEFSAPGDFTIDLQLYEGDGTGGALLDSTTVTLPYTGFKGFADADFSSTTLTLGNVYSLVATQDTARWLLSPSSASYSGGSAIFFGSPNPGNHRGFRAVPEPAAAALAMIATALLAFRRRR